MSFKDYFSTVAANYRESRPSNIPAELFAYLSDITSEHQIAYDCGTGNGQIANQLTPYFEKVYASDASSKQIKYAIKKPKIEYFVATAESSPLQSNLVDLITVSQAFHWFDRDAFYTEAKRILKPNGILAIWCYGLFNIPEASESLNKCLDKLFKLVKPFWPPEIQLIEDKYQTISFPFKEILTPEGRFSMTHDWTAEQLIRYLCTWSSTQKLVKEQGKEELNNLSAEIAENWITSQKAMTINWPLYFRVGLTE